ncbi:MAG: prolipoprotein diacylglyceryl transferase [Verrucomicrobia bacterium]|nr:prolipoprotein diacylglyceryl transferase [Verrucomicrobiota bacterium]
MSSEDLFVVGLGLVFGGVLTWGFRVLPGERWQILASVPRDRDEAGGWRGLNLTWYGVLSATANVVGTALALVLLTALGIPLAAALSMTAVTLALSVPGARWLARLVEKKSSTFTVAGASLLGFTFGPWIVWTHLQWFPGLPSEAPSWTVPALAALGTAYAVGEGLGRLACISFGCCYGKPIRDFPARWQPWLMRFAFVFDSPLKKASYEGGLRGSGTFPIQAVTSVVLLAVGLASAALLLHRQATAAFLVAVVGSQAWRFGSEFLRADQRGGGRLSAYQFMAVFSALYAVLITAVLPAGETQPHLLAGLAVLLRLEVVLGLQALWLAILWFMGRSTVTASRLTFHLVRERL